MNSDIRVSTGFPHNRKTLELQALLGGDGIAGLVFLWCYAGQHEPSGTFRGWSGTQIELAAGWRGMPGALLAALLQVGFLEQRENGYTLHSWDEWNTYAMYAEDRVRHAKKMAELRWGNRLKSRRNKKLTSNAASNAVTDNKHMPERDSSNAPFPAPSPIPSPVPDQKEQKTQYRPAVTLTATEHAQLVELIGATGTEDYLDRLNDWKLAKGKKTKSDYHTIRMWYIKNGGAHGTEGSGSVSSCYDAPVPTVLKKALGLGPPTTG